MAIIGKSAHARKLSLAHIVAEHLSQYNAVVNRNVMNSAGNHTDSCLVQCDLGNVHITAIRPAGPNGYVELDFGHADQSFTIDKDYFAFGYDSKDNTRTFVFILKAADVVGKLRMTLDEVRKLKVKELSALAHL